MSELSHNIILKLMNDNFKERDEKIKRLEDRTEVLKEAYHVQRIEISQLHALLTPIEEQLKHVIELLEDDEEEDGEEEDKCKNFLENVKQMIDEFLAT
jgi:hypothetical protein